jgi:hypothetical protein
MKRIIIRNLTKQELEKINGGGKIAKTLGKALHYMIDQFYKAGTIESTYHRNGSY